MKKFLILFTTILALTVTGCSSDNNTENTNTENTNSSQQETQEDESDKTSQEYYEYLASQGDNSFPQLKEPEEGDTIAIMHTSMGDISFMFFADEAPKAVENFLTHAEEGYYDGVTFHRVIDGFMIQGGDPTGTGSGGESIWGEPFEDEFSPNLYNIRGALCMANSGPNTNGSQFFIVQSQDPYEDYIDYKKSLAEEYGAENLLTNSQSGTLFRTNYSEEAYDVYREYGGAIHLDYVHTVFGQVIDGMDVVDSIAATEVDENDKPVNDVIIESIEVTQY